MSGRVVFWTLCLAGVGVLAGAAGLGLGNAGIVVLVVVLAFGVWLISLRMTSPADQTWLPAAVMAGFAAKMLASGARFWVLMVLYRGVGDATGYHAKGLRYADEWRSLSVPPIGIGTDFIPAATGFVYVPYKPTMLGGFLIFATLAFLGQLLLYAAFRRWAAPEHLKWYALLVFFFPTIAYWPASIGKEALMMLFIGVAAYGAARLFVDYRFLWGLVLALGLAGCAAIRSHMALLLAGATFGTVILARGAKSAAAQARRLVMVAVAGLILVAAVGATSRQFRLDLSAGVSADIVTEELDPFLSTVEGRSDRGGSAVEGGTIRSPRDVPEGLLRVLFRPLPHEAHNIQALASSIEGTLLLTLLVWRLPSMLRNSLHIRKRPYALFALLYTGGFIFAFSAVLNLGILARQRSQVLPFVFALLVELGTKATTQPSVAPTRAPVQVRPRTAVSP